MKKAVRLVIAEILKQVGVKYAFGHTGGHIRQMWQAIDQSGIKPIFNKQEGNAAYMADGYYKLTGKMAVVLGTSGPGVQNMVSGIASAFLDSAPMIIIGAMVPTYSAGRNAIQDSSGRGRGVEQRLIFKACCKQAMSAQTPEAVPAMTREAVRVALSGRPGPVYIEIPSDFWNQEIEYSAIKPEQYLNLNLPSCQLNDCQMIQSAFYQAQQPLILIGEGAIEPGIREKLFNFIQKTQVPFAVSPRGKDLVDEYQALYLGAMRTVPGKQKLYQYLKSTDFILLLGERLNQWELDWEYNFKKAMPRAKLAQVDPDPDEIGRAYPVDLSAVGSVVSFIDSFALQVYPKAKELINKLAISDRDFARKKIYPDGQKGVNPMNLTVMVEQLADKQAIIVTDTGYVGSRNISKFRTKLTQRFLLVDRNSAMGYSVPAAIGAALAVKNRREVVCFVSDGSFQMTLNELGLLMDYPAKVIFIIENDGGCSMITSGNLAEYGKTCVTEFTNPDYVQLAKAYGLKSWRVETSMEFEKAFKQAKQEKNSVIIEVKTDFNSTSWD